MEVTLVCSLKVSIDLPDDLKNEDEVRKYLNWAYVPSEILERGDIEDFVIEDIENCPYEYTDADKFDDMWHSGELS